jgi:D-beta-D-heptose 7-phosphate kinase/D-beta-D-heptose 1-phosphate adenosyltransferase
MRVWVNGAFDVLHIGHLNLLKHASTIGSVRVGIDTDDRIKELKGSNRPFNCFKNRMEFLKSLRFVDDVVGFGSEEELINQIKEYQPDVMVIGSDYKDKRIIGIEYVKEVSFFNRIPNVSTTSILEYEKDSSNRRTLP